MISRELIKKYLQFFKDKGHAVIPSYPLIPENDPTALFISAGMHPLVPYLLGEVHPAGKRLVNLQLCLRTGDIDMVGDSFHHTFFEMLGNWSLGDYGKKESITYSYEFLTKELAIASEKLFISCFAGDADAPKDLETAEIWESLGISKDHIVFLPKKDNWWGPAGETGPCGPDTEIFYNTGQPSCGPECKPGDNCGRFIEIWNNVFMVYNKTKDGVYEPLKQQNIDTGMGVDRTTAVLNGLADDYLVKDLWGAIIMAIENVAGKKYQDDKKAFRIIADHLRAATFVAAEGIIPDNKQQGYILRRLIRRAVRFGKQLGIGKPFSQGIIDSIIESYGKFYPRLGQNKEEIKKVISGEEEKFDITLEKGLKEIDKMDKLDGKKAFFLYESYGFPLELTEEIAFDKGQTIDKEEFEKEFTKHKALSRTASAGMFKGGLADASKEVTRLHTATHLLHAALRKILGEHISQKGSNITAERLRFDFSHSAKLTDEEIHKIVALINEQVDKELSVVCKTQTQDEAVAGGALHFFAEKYGDKVKVYTIGGEDEEIFSKEICGGPHVENTRDIGHVRIIKQEKVGSGTFRIYLTNKPE